MAAPLASMSCETPLPVKTPAPRSAGATDPPLVLLVDDSATQRRLIQYLLQGSGNWRVVAVADGRAALETMERGLPDLVLADIFMPQLDGLGLAREIASRYPQVPVVLMSSQGNERIAVDAVKAGAADYLSKQHLPESLAGVLERVLENAQEEKEQVRLCSRMTGRVSRYELENDPALVTPLVAGLRADLVALDLCNPFDAIRTGIALEEALLNAIYHGNLEVSSELRKDGDEPFHRLARERRIQDPYRRRRVSISARMTRDRATFVIADQGPGFDISHLPDPTDPAYLERPSGRGLLLIRMFMDDVRYNGSGNQITMVKKRTARE